MAAGRTPAGPTSRPASTPIPAAALSVADADQLERIVARGKPVTLKLMLTPRNDRHARVRQRHRRGAGHRSEGGHRADRRTSRQLGSGHRRDRRRRGRRDHDRRGEARDGCGRRPRRTIRVVWFGARKSGGFGGAGLCRGAHAGERHAIASEIRLRRRSRLALRDSTCPTSATAVGDRLATALAPLGIVRGTGVRRRRHRCRADASQAGVAAVDLNQSGTALFRLAPHARRHARAHRSRRNCSRMSRPGRRCSQIVANAPEEIGSVVPRP